MRKYYTALRKLGCKAAQATVGAKLLAARKVPGDWTSADVSWLANALRTATPTMLATWREIVTQATER